MAREVELEEMNIIIKVPKDALKVTIKVQVPGFDGEIIKAKKKLTKTDIDAARKDFLDNVEDGDDFNAKFVVTEKGTEYLKQLQSKEEGESYYDEIGGFHSPCNCYNPLGYYCGDCTKLSCKGCSYATIEKETSANYLRKER